MMPAAGTEFDHGAIQQLEHEADIPSHGALL